MIRILGEALVDLVIEPDGAVSAALGGAPYNTARAVGRLGRDVEFVGVLSEDRFGSMLTGQLASDRVAVEHAPRTTSPTTLAAAELDESGSASYHFYFDGTSAPALSDADLDGLPPADIVFTGGLGLVLEPMAATVGRAVVGVDDATTVVVDVNCRPNVIADRDRYVEGLRRVLARTDVVKVSEEDLAYLIPDDDLDISVDTLLELGPAAVLVTRGADATTIHTPAGTATVAVLGAPDVVDTIGAGDTFDGAFLASWTQRGHVRADLRGPEALEALTRSVEEAQVAAAIVVTRRGADPPWRHELPHEWGT